ncbi:carotenoid 1,2-hydratase [Roseateles amylovorans]|uniref:Carotenoid 1,2-hydratase n=1 Tax=Roseateles amylovorans TaxID=2978473 RepID=A0ABY6AVI5_9BURK|nr:carotenoid 1,2-hydratase [Roseateles amylovorans]UXH76810.1 carotenoid 1,2-hydratase [Roseateles amylovorans]
MSRAALRFPRDHGAHPETRIEWWYVTGVLRTPGATLDTPPAYGFQLTFFRVRRELTRPLDSAFVPDQLMLGHAALSDLGQRRLVHDQRLLRRGFANARSDEADTRVRLGDWSLVRQDGERGLSRYTLSLRSEHAGFGLRLDLQAPQAPLLQGDQGWSRKGPGAEQASRYVSEPQLAGRGRLTRTNELVRELEARCWLDHEWSNQYLGAKAETAPDRAVGWDWMGMNLNDGSALTLFQMRRRDGKTLWTGGSWRDADGRQIDLQQRVSFEPVAHWESPASLAQYPVRWRIRTPRGVLRVDAAFNAQEIDAQRSTGFLYWEGVARLSDDAGRLLGWGYLEMTGYAGRVPL